MSGSLVLLITCDVTTLSSHSHSLSLSFYHPLLLSHFSPFFLFGIIILSFTSRSTLVFLPFSSSLSYSQTVELDGYPVVLTTMGGAKGNGIQTKTPSSFQISIFYIFVYIYFNLFVNTHTYIYIISVSFHVTNFKNFLII